MHKPQAISGKGFGEGCVCVCVGEGLLYGIHLCDETAIHSRGVVYAYGNPRPFPSWLCSEPLAHTVTHSFKTNIPASVSGTSASLMTNQGSRPRERGR